MNDVNTSGPTRARHLPCRLPVFAAPMFLVSGPDLVIAACRAGIGAALPAPNARTVAQLDDWLTAIRHGIARAIVTYRTQHQECELYYGCSDGGRHSGFLLGTKIVQVTFKVMLKESY